MTVAIHLSEPYAPMLTMLASSIGGLAGISPAAVMQYGKDFSRHGGGTGPFKFKLWESSQRFVLEANKDYWGGAPKLDGLVFRPIIDENARVSEMLSGGTDITIEVPPDNIATFTDPAKFTYYEQAGPHLWYLLLNTKEKPFDDKRVRQAANYAINKDAMVNQILKGTATVAAGPTPAAFTWAHDNDLKPYPYDPAKAKALLAEAGYPNGVDVTFYVTESGSGMLSPILMGTAIQADLAAVGISAKVETYEWNTFLGKIIPGMEGKAQIAELSFMTQDPDMHPFLGAAHRRAGEFRRLLQRQGRRADRLRAAPNPIPQNAPRSTSSCRRSSTTTRPGCSSPTGSRTRYPRLGEGLRTASLVHDAFLQDLQGLSAVDEIAAWRAYILRRCLMMAPVLFGVTVIVFLVISLDPRRSGEGHPRHFRHAREHRQGAP